MESLVSTTLNVERQTQNGAIKTTIIVDMPLDTPFANLASLIHPLMELAPSKLSVSLASKIAPIVTDGPSNYNPAELRGLKINVDEPLVSWYKAYRRAIGLAPQTKVSSKSMVSSRWMPSPMNGCNMVNVEESSITVGAAVVQFKRTLRVPDDATSYALPPGLGTFPLAKAQDYYSSLPDYIAQRGGYIMPLFQREALSIGIFEDSLYSSGNTAICAIKISVGGINVVTGSKQDEDMPEGLQDYVVGGKQPWLDGIATEPGVVRQFVAMKLGHGYTIEEQLSNTAAGGIQIDVFPSLLGVVTFRHNGLEAALDASPRSLNIKPGEMMLMTSTHMDPLETLRDVVWFVTQNPILNVSYRELPPPPAAGSASMRIFIKNDTRGVFHFIVETSDTIGKVKSLIEIMDGIPLSDQQLMFGANILENGRALTDYGIKCDSQLRLVVQPRMQIFINIMRREILTLLTDSFDTVDMIMLDIERKTGVLPEHQHLSFGGETLECGKIINDYSIRDGSTLDLWSTWLMLIGHTPPQETRMGIAAGGKIVQKIYSDTHSPLVYDEEDAERVFIHTVSTAAWEMITGVVCPLTPITPALYNAFDYPWFSVYDEHLPTIQPTGQFSILQSVLQTDYVSSNESINPISRPNCSRHTERTSTCIARPCSHLACAECLGDAIFAGGKCAYCNAKTDMYAGFDKPVQQVSTDGGELWEAETRIQGISTEHQNRQVTTLMLYEDRVSCLHGRSVGHACQVTAASLERSLLAFACQWFLSAFLCLLMLALLINQFWS